MIGWPHEKEFTGYNNHEVATIIADLLDDDCACNFNDNNEWLPEYCDFKDTCCPHPVGVACWEQYLKYREHKKDQPSEAACGR